MHQPDKEQNQIALVLPYYGKLPIWFEAFILSCSYNLTIDWLIFTDLNSSMDLPTNVRFISCSKNEIIELITLKTGIKHPLLNPHKLCDFKPIYGHIFEDYLKKYSYWGHCDMDIIWGNLSAFLSRVSFHQYDVVSSRKNVISGHFTIYRNSSKLNYFYKSVPNFLKAFTQTQYQGFDEGFFSYHLHNEIEAKRSNLKVFWDDRNCIDRGELEKHPTGWYWQSGEIRNTNGITGTYLHMIDWKKSIKTIPLDLIENPYKFQINKYGIWRDIPHKIKVQLSIHSVINWLKRKFRRVKALILRKGQIIKGPNVLPQYQILE